MTEKATLLVLAPTPAEYALVKEQLGNKKFSNFDFEILETGPGKINAALALGEKLGGSHKSPSAIVVGVGTSGSLNLKLKCGDILASNECVISDWRHEDGSEVWVGPYGVFNYAPPDNEVIGGMLIREDDPLIEKLIQKLENFGFFPGRILTSDTFVSGKDLKLCMGRAFNADVCDMESGAFAYCAKRKNARFFNLRVVADTLDETLSDYFQKETDVARILGIKALEALAALDSLIPEL
jgi:nucleoside phosphorylase